MQTATESKTVFLMSSDKANHSTFDTESGGSGHTPQRIREYELDSRIGQGGMGTVYLASHTMLERQVAIKFLSPAQTHDPQYVSRFRREMKAVGRLTHPNIVQAFDAGEQDGTHFLVMEYVDGLDVAAVQNSLTQLSIADACEIIRQAAVGLQHAHGNGLVHRDIKPSNLLLSRDGTVKVLDLGLALFHEAEMEVADQLTHTGQIMGTLDFMAPEQADDTHTVDIRADIYSLGCTLFTLLAGQPPFSGPQFATPMKKLAAHLKNSVPPIDEHRGDVPPELAALLNRMVARDPQDRIATPGEVAEAIGAFTAFSNLEDVLNRAESVRKKSLQPNGRPDDTQPDVPSALAETQQMPTNPGYSEEQIPVTADGRSDDTDPVPTDLPLAPAGTASRRRKSGRLLPVILITTGLIAAVLLVARFALTGPDSGGDVAGTADSSGSETGESHGAGTSAQEPAAYALWFDGDGDYAEAASPIIDGRYPFTLEAWVTPESAAHIPVIGCLNSDGGVLLRIYDGHWAVVFRDEKWQSNYEEGVTAAIGQRTHVAVVYDQVEVRLYVNGQLAQTLRNSGNVVVPQDAPFRIGMSEQQGSAPLFFEGQIDAVRISRSARYRDSFQPPGRLTAEESTVVLYDFARGSEEVLRNLINSEHSAAIHDAKWIPIHGGTAEASRAEVAKQSTASESLDDWLRGRRILTVAQDGTGQYKSIQSALDALQPGQAVEVLDSGPYAECLNLVAVPEDAGLVTRHRTIIVASAPATRIADEDQFAKHQIRGANSFRLSGFTLSGSTQREESSAAPDLLFVEGADVTIEDCVFSWAVPDDSAAGAALSVLGENGRIRRCVVSGQCRMMIANGGQFTVEKCLLNSAFALPVLQIAGMADSVTASFNVIDNPDGEGVLIGNDAAEAPVRLTLQHNTIRCGNNALAWLGQSTTQHIQLSSNIFGGQRVMPKSGDRSYWMSERNLVSPAHVQDTQVRLMVQSREISRGVKFRSRDIRNKLYMQADASELETLPGQYAGALSPDAESSENDWFTQLAERQREVSSPQFLLEQP